MSTNNWPDSAKPSFHLWARSICHPTTFWAALFLLAVSGLNQNSAHAQETYWMGRVEGTQYIFDNQLPQSFGDTIAKANKDSFKVEKNPRPFHYLDIAGIPYSLLKTSVTSDWEMFENRLPNRSVSIVSKSGAGGAADSWITMESSDPLVEQFARNLPKRTKGVWFKAELMILVSPDANQPRTRSPVPPTTLARNGMISESKHTMAGFFYPQVRRPTHINPFREHMLAYGNAGRRDPDFRKNNGSKTATDLSGETTYAGEHNKWETVTKDSPTAPYFADHVVNQELTEAAQFQAEYQASIDKMTHDGPASYKGDARLEDFNTRVGYFNGPGKSFEACGLGSMGDFPHAWMVGETHFRPWFNVNGAIHQVGYGAAKNPRSGTWYYSAVISQTPVAGQTTKPVVGNAVAVANPAVPNSGTSPSSPPAMQPDSSIGGSQFTTGKKLSVASMDATIKKMTDPNLGGYRLVYDADLEKLGGRFSYDADNSQSVGSFDSIGYLLEVGTKSSIETSVFDADPVQKVFVTMKAFTTDATKIGIPVHSEAFQQAAESMNVYSTVDGIGGSGTGSIEFWANDYLPGDSGIYDSNDKKAGRDIGYGSMQIHNARGQTVFALNAWNDGPQADIGIGDSAINHEGKIHKDWTFANNAASYTSKRLRVYVRSGQSNVSTTPPMTGRPSVRQNSAATANPAATTAAPANSVSRLTSEERNEFVQYHNRVRAEVGVGKVTWSEDCARVAQEWADKLALSGDFQHRNHVGGQWKTVYGENLAWGGGANYRSKNGIDFWYAEKKDYTPGTPAPAHLNGPMIGHYTQMVWRKTERIGAGVAVIQAGRYKGGLVIVCNYDPPGNYGGEMPY